MVEAIIKTEAQITKALINKLISKHKQHSSSSTSSQALAGTSSTSRLAALQTQADKQPPGTSPPWHYAPRKRVYIHAQVADQVRKHKQYRWE
jgi:hypothetical protein